MLTTSAAVAQPRRAVAIASSIFPSPRTECASVEATIVTPGLDRQPHLGPGEVVVPVPRLRPPLAGSLTSMSSEYDGADA